MYEWGETFGDTRALGTSAFTEKQANVLRRTQDDLIDEMQQIAERWCARRHETVEAMFQLGVASLRNNNPVAISELWMRWCKGALRRWSEDTSDQVELAVVTAKCCGNGALVSDMRTEGQRTTGPKAKSPVVRRRAKKAPTRARRVRRAMRRQ
jgi:hypothetical protein